MSTKKRNLVAYAVVSTLVVFGGGAALGFGLNSSPKQKPAAVSAPAPTSSAVTPQQAGVELARAYNATPPQTVQIIQLVHCYPNPQNASEFACAAVATDGKQQACIAIKGIVETGNETGKPVKVESVQQIKPSFCQ